MLFVPTFTTPLNPLRPLTVRFDAPEVPELTVTLVGLAVIVKSCIVYRTFVECARVPLTPVTFTSTIAAVGKVHDSVELPEPVMLVGEMEHFVLFVESVTGPVNPLTEAIVIVEVAMVPALTVRVVGLADIVKSCEVYVTVAV